MESLEQLKAKDVLEQIEQVIPQIASAYKVGALYCTRQPEPVQKTGSEYNYKHDSVQLLTALYNALGTSKEKVVSIDSLERAIPQKVVYSVKNKSRHILSRLKLRDISLGELYSECKTRSEVVATFVSVLELCSMGSITISHSKDGKGYELSFVGGNFDDILELIDD